MGYWSQDENGNSFAIDSDLIWGDSPADIFDEAIDKITKQHCLLTGMWPTKQQIVNSFAKELGAKLAEDASILEGAEEAIKEAVSIARAEFKDDIGRPPSDKEMILGLLFSLGAEENVSDPDTGREKLIHSF